MQRPCSPGPAMESRPTPVTENKSDLEPKGQKQGPLKELSHSEPQENVLVKPDPHSRWKFHPILKIAQTLFPADYEDHDELGE